MQKKLAAHKSWKDTENALRNAFPEIIQLPRDFNTHPTKHSSVKEAEFFNNNFNIVGGLAKSLHPLMPNILFNQKTDDTAESLARAAKSALASLHQYASSNNTHAIRQFIDLAIIMANEVALLTTQFPSDLTQIASHYSHWPVLIEPDEQWSRKIKDLIRELRLGEMNNPEKHFARTISSNLISFLMRAQKTPPVESEASTELLFSYGFLLRNLGISPNACPEISVLRKMFLGKFNRESLLEKSQWELPFRALLKMITNNTPEKIPALRILGEYRKDAYASKGGTDKPAKAIRTQETNIRDGIYRKLLGAASSIISEITTSFNLDNWPNL